MNKPTSIDDLIVSSELLEPHVAFIASTCVQSIRLKDKHNLSSIINKLIHYCTVDLLVDKQDVNMIVAFIIYDEDCIYYAYTKKAYRKAGMFTRLLNDMKHNCSFTCFCTIKKLKQSELEFIKYFK